MVWNWVVAYCGLSRPYRFRRVIAALAAATLGAAVAATVIGFAVTGELNRHTPRELYFLYLAGLTVLGFAMAPWPRLSVPVLALLMVDFCLGIGSHVLRKFDLADSSVLPPQLQPGQRICLASSAAGHADPVPKGRERCALPSPTVRKARAAATTLKTNCGPRPSLLYSAAPPHMTSASATTIPGRYNSRRGLAKFHMLSSTTASLAIRQSRT